MLPTFGFHEHFQATVRYSGRAMSQALLPNRRHLPTRTTYLHPPTTRSLLGPSHLQTAAVASRGWHHHHRQASQSSRPMPVAVAAKTQSLLGPCVTPAAEFGLVFGVVRVTSGDDMAAHVSVQRDRRSRAGHSIVWSRKILVAGFWRVFVLDLDHGLGPGDIQCGNKNNIQYEGLGWLSEPCPHKSPLSRAYTDAHPPIPALQVGKKEINSRRFAP